MRNLEERSRAATDNEKSKWAQMLFQKLVHQVLLSDRTDLLEFMITLALQRQLDTPAEVFALMSQLEEWDRGKEDAWPGSLLGNRPGSGSSFAPQPLSVGQDRLSLNATGRNIKQRK